ncbi:MAG: DUF58 domain-containing protein [Deltaproteobacteria bacterium]|nr:MAG: DUF58 domain-containing protein [Deltaproteobacteria bacterium]
MNVAASKRPARRRSGGRPAGVLRDLRQAIAPLVRAWSPVPPTFLGLTLVAVALWAFFAIGKDDADHVVYALSAVALAMVALSNVVVGAAAFFLWRALRARPSGVPETLMAGTEATTYFACPSLRFWPLVQVAVAWGDPDTAAVTLEPDGATFIERVTPSERGRYAHVTRRFTVRDIFGFASLTFSRTWDQPLRVVPAVGRADTTLAVRRATSDGYSHPSGQPIGEMVEMRRYVYGDPMRHVIWKTFARDRQLMVREPERAIAPRPAMVAFFVAGEHDEPSASTARVFLEQGLLGADFVFAAEGAPRPTHDRGEALEQVIRSRAHRDTQADGLISLFRAVDRARLDNLVIFVPASDGPWIDKVLTASRRLPLPPMLVLTVDGELESATRSRAQRFLWEHEDHSDPTLRDLPAVYDRLRAANADVRVIHRASGRRLEATQIDALRAL